MKQQQRRARAIPTFVGVYHNIGAITLAGLLSRSRATAWLWQPIAAQKNTAPVELAPFLMFVDDEEPLLPPLVLSLLLQTS